MKILVLAREEQKKEFHTCPVQAGVEFIWSNTPGDIADHPLIDACIDLSFENKTERVNWLRQLKVPVIINEVIVPLKEIDEDFVRINGWNTMLQRPIIEAACNNEALRTNATALFSLLGKQTEWVDDIPGFITPRVIACLVNEAYMVLEEKVSVEEEIDIAMKMGTNYPYGPFEWSRKIGLSNVFHLLKALSRTQSRYKPSILMEQSVLA